MSNVLVYYSGQRKTVSVRSAERHSVARCTSSSDVVGHETILKTPPRVESEDRKVKIDSPSPVDPTGKVGERVVDKGELLCPSCSSVSLDNGASMHSEGSVKTLVKQHKSSSIRIIGVNYPTKEDRRGNKEEGGEEGEEEEVGSGTPIPQTDSKRALFRTANLDSSTGSASLQDEEKKNASTLTPMGTVPNVSCTPIQDKYPDTDQFISNEPLSVDGLRGEEADSCNSTGWPTGFPSPVKLSPIPSKKYSPTPSKQPFELASVSYPIPALTTAEEEGTAPSHHRSTHPLDSSLENSNPEGEPQKSTTCVFTSSVNKTDNPMTGMTSSGTHLLTGIHNNTTTDSEDIPPPPQSRAYPFPSAHNSTEIYTRPMNSEDITAISIISPTAQSPTESYVSREKENFFPSSVLRITIPGVPMPPPLAPPLQFQRPSRNTRCLISPEPERIGEASGNWGHLTHDPPRGEPVVLPPRDSSSFHRHHETVAPTIPP